MSDASLPPVIKARLRATIQSHPNVFKLDLGTIKRITAKLEMNVEAQPKFYKARPAPYALQEAVEAEYNRLESKSIVEKVECETPLGWRIKSRRYHAVMWRLSCYCQPTT